MMRARILTATSLLALIAALAFTTTANAHLVRFSTAFNTYNPGNVQYPIGVAVEQATGNLYLAGYGSGNVAKLTPSGTVVRAYVSPHFEEPRALAIDNSPGASKGDVYVAVLGAPKVVKLGPTGAEVAGFTPITATAIPAGKVGSAEFSPTSVAVDPENGDVVVGDFTGGEVDIFSSSGVFISQFAVPGGKGQLRGIAVGSGSEIVTSGKGVQEWSASDGYATPTTITTKNGFGVAVDLATGEIFVDRNGEAILEFEASGAELLEFGEGLIGEESSYGVAVNEATNVVYAANLGSSQLWTFAPVEDVAQASTVAPATAVTSRTADVSGAVEPEGLEVTGCSFEYGLSSAYSSIESCSTPLPLTGNTPTPVEGALEEGLQPNQTYHYRLVVSTAAGPRYAGGPAYGEDQTFKTQPAAPSIDGESVSGLSQTSGTLNAGVNPNNQATTYRFEYGNSAAYGQVTPVAEGEVGSGYGNVAFGRELTGLSPGTTYHFRVLARNATGTETGPDRTFTTPPLQPPVVSTEAAENVGQNTATLLGSVETQGFETTYEFDIGADTSYGSRIFGDAGSVPGTQTVAVSLQDLTPGTIYHYRILATNAFGTIYGVDHTFTTASYPSSILTAPPVSALVPAPAAGAPTRIVTVKPKPKAKKKKKTKTKKKTEKHKASHGKGRK